MKCDDIEWLVDMLGTIQLLKTVGYECNVADISGYGTARTQFQSGKAPNGLYFNKGHWYAVKDGATTDSYTEGYQIKGTAHFCQTFAMMIYVGQTSNLVSGKYKDNIVYAMQFWIDVLTAQKEIREWFIQEIKTSTWKNLTPEGMPKLSSVTWTHFKNFLIKVQNSAGDLTGCIEG